MYKCLSIELIDSTSTSMTLVGRHPARYDGTRTGFYRGSIRDGIICEGDTLVMKSMTPNNEFMCHYFLGSEDESLTFKFTTPELILNIENPQGVSATSTIVAAETNLSEEEAGAGFQWRKYDAPETLPWSEANAAIYGGRLEGIIRNLQPTSYYNVRAFYKSASGNYYYSDFVTFDPSDFSYFEPTVHTYPAESVTAQTADVRGYVLPGTDEITSQGFEYRPASASNAPAKRIAATPKAETAAGTSVVMATGQVMTATITDLAPATTYTMRAFATTQAGTTYGEEQTFTTATMSGIQAPATATTPTVTGYYDMSGRKLDAPQKGLTIVRYSDGTAKKIFTR